MPDSEARLLEPGQTTTATDRSRMALASRGSQVDVGVDLVHSRDVVRQGFGLWTGDAVTSARPRRARADAGARRRRHARSVLIERRLPADHGRGKTFLGDIDVLLADVEAEAATFEFYGRDGRGAGTHKGIEH